MKKIPILVIVGILIGSSIGAIGTQGKQGTSTSLSEHLQTPAIQKQSVDTDGYLLIELTGTSTFQTKGGQPQLPKIVRTVELPFGATDIQVSLSPGDIT